MNDLEVSMSSLNETLIFCIHKDEISKTKPGASSCEWLNYSLKVNSQPHRECVVKVNTLIGKGWDPKNWNGTYE